MQYVNIILPLALPQLLTYSVPESLENYLEAGKRVTVQLGNKKLYSGIIYEIHSNPPTDFKVKHIINILDDKPIVDANQLNLWKWVANYYMCTLGEVMKAALPSGLKLESETKVSIAANINLDNYTSTSLDILLEVQKKPLAISEIAKKLSGNKTLSDLKKLQEDGSLNFGEELKEKYAQKTKQYIYLHPDITSDEMLNTILESLKAPKQKQLLETYIGLAAPVNYNEPLAIAKDELLIKANTSSAIIKTCFDKNIFQTKEMQVDRIDNSSVEIKKELPLLNKTQLAAYQAIDEENSKPILLHGVTSSGKTEVYIKLISEYLDKGKQVLYLLPEIALTTQIITRLQAVFGNKVGVYHSKFSDSERVEIYNNLLNRRNEEDNSYVILGVRSSIFLPYNNLGLIIVDEEHESTYKQYDPAPRYNARDSSVVLASLHKAKVLMGSATPSIESYTNAITKKYKLVEMHTRFGNAVLPTIEVVDMVTARKKKKVNKYFSDRLLSAIRESLDRKEQVIIFQNRRGFSPYVQCDQCGHVPQCKHCSVSLTYHKYNNMLTCHYCGYSEPLTNVCTQCNSLNLKPQGIGTEQIEDELAILIPTARISRLDLDSTRSKYAYERILGAFDREEVDILVGTQMVTKGLDFSNVSLVGVLNADNMLNFPDFRAYEKSYQLMSQVAGRSGRKDVIGNVIIQTSSPENTVINKVVDHNYRGFFAEEIDLRKLFFYPPFSRLIVITLKHSKLNVVDDAAYHLGHMLKSLFDNNVAGPEVPAISRVQNRYIINFRIKMKNDNTLPKYKIVLMECFSTLQIHKKEFASLQLVVDVDPY